MEPTLYQYVIFYYFICNKKLRMVSKIFINYVPYLIGSHSALGVYYEH